MNFIDKRISKINIDDVINLNVEEFYNEIKILEQFLSQITFWEVYEYAKKKNPIKEIELEILPIPTYQRIAPEKVRQDVQTTSYSLAFSGSPSHTVSQNISKETMKFVTHWDNRVRLGADNNPLYLSISKEVSESDNYRHNRDILQWDIPENVIFRDIHIKNISSLKEYRKLKKDPVFNQEIEKIEQFTSSIVNHLFHKLTGEIIVDMLHKNKDIVININNNSLSDPLISTDSEEINTMYNEHIKKLESPLLKNYIYKALLGSNYTNINSSNFAEKLPASMKLMREHWHLCKKEFDIIQEKKSLSNIISSLNIEVKKNNRI